MRKIELKSLAKGTDFELSHFQCSGPACTANHEEAADADEIVLPASGVFVRRDADGEAFIDPTQVALFHKGEPYEIDHPVSAPDSCVILSVPPSLRDEILKEQRVICNQPGERVFPCGHVQADFSSLLRLHNIVAQMQRIGAEDGLEAPCQVSEAVGIVLDLCNGSAGAYSARVTPLGRRDRRIVRGILAYINMAYDEPIQLDDICRAINVSKFHACRVFKREIGSTIAQYITRLRLTRALDLLRDPQLTVTEIAFSLGFSSHSHFTSRFQQYFGAAPSRALN